MAITATKTLCTFINLLIVNSLSKNKENFLPFIRQSMLEEILPPRTAQL